MGSVVRFSAVNAKVRALEGRMLDSNQIMKLLDCKSFKESLHFLNEHTNYREVLKNYNIEDLHRGQLELILKRDYIKKFDKFVHYFNSYYKELLKILFIRFEIEDIKVIIRGKFIKKSPTELNSLVTYQSSLSSISYEELIKADSLENVISKLKDTMYYRHIANLSRDIYKEGFFRFETELDFVYFMHLRDFVKKLNKEDRIILEEINGIQVDLINLQWIFRAKKYYELSPEVILSYTIYDGYRLNKDNLKELSYSKSVNDFYDMLEGMHYGNIFRSAENQEYLLEREILSYLKKMFLKYKREYRTNISVLIAFLELSYLEMRDIITIVENKRYSVKYDESLKYITGVHKL
jgi:V/A-type H+/Na+-transporting ATPase subunit C